MDKYFGVNSTTGNKVSFNRKWGKKYFTDDECEKLCNGKTITFNHVTQDGRPCVVSGKIDTIRHNGVTFTGFKPDFVEKLNNENSKQISVEKQLNTKELKKDFLNALLDETSNTKKLTNAKKKENNTATITNVVIYKDREEAKLYYSDGTEVYMSKKDYIENKDIIQVSTINDVIREYATDVKIPYALN